MAGFYEADLAFIHHDGYRDVQVKSAGFLLRQIRAAGLGKGRVVDLGCGGGWWMARLAKTGYQPHGVDISKAMLALARKTVPQATLQHGSSHEVKLPDCVAITALGESLGYLSGPRQKELPMLRTFAKVFRALQPGGVFIFDLIVSDGRQDLTANHITEGPGWLATSRNVEDREAGRLVRNITTFREHGKQSDRSWRRTDEAHHVRLYGRKQVESWLLQAGFRVKVARRFGDYALLPRRLGFIATRPKKS